MVKLYKLDASPPARACMMACDLFSVPAEMVDCNIIVGEHMTPDFLKKNPTHTIPVLEDGDLIIHDSHAILMYLADVYGKQDSLYPKDLKQRALVNQKMFFNSSILFPRLRNISSPLLLEGAKPTEKQYKAIDEAYGFLEEFLSRNKYVAGNKMTIADIAAYATSSTLGIMLELDVKKYPKIEAWHKEMAKQSFAQKQNAAGRQEFKRVYDDLMSKMVKLYKLNGSPPARACMMACDLFNVPAEMVDCNILTGEHMTPDFLKKNPLHTIPVLEDGDLIIHDSHAILMYLADVYGKQDSLYPKDLKQRALVNQKMFFNSSILFPRLRNITYPLFIEGAKPTEKLYKAIDEAYGFLEEFLSRNKYLAGNNMTIADIAAYATSSSLGILLELDVKKYPKIEAWHKEMAKQSFAQKQNAAGNQELKRLYDNLMSK
ncbi:glutathione S-transferase D7-like [Choristoneura fumiferana]|uniref:glutathione S-transferase D7-like n=1 Tax=Choristoneura fumiferana TaxID=7141 RepID=UPI003D155188